MLLEGFGSLMLILDYLRHSMEEGKLVLPELEVGVSSLI